MSRLSIVLAVLALGIVLLGTPAAVMSQEGTVSDEPLPVVKWPSEARFVLVQPGTPQESPLVLWPSEARFQYLVAPPESMIVAWPAESRFEFAFAPASEMPVVAWPSEVRYEYAFGPMTEEMPVVAWPSEVRYEYAFGPMTEEMPLVAWPSEVRYEYAFGPMIEEMPLVAWPSEVRYEYAFGSLTEELPLVRWPSEERFVYAMTPAVANMQSVNKALLGSVLEALFVDGDADGLYAAYPAELAAIRLDEWMAWQSAFGDMDASFDFQLAEGDRVLSCWRFSGVHEGEFLGLAPTGREINFRALFSARIVDGQIVEEVGGIDLAELMGQMGPVEAS